MHICFSSQYIVLFPLRTPASWRSAKCTRRLFKVWRNGQIQNWYVILKGENVGFHLNINVSVTLENFNNYTQPYMHICFSSNCTVLFPLRSPASWRSAKCTRRLFMVWRNWPNSKWIRYTERGEPRLSFE